MAERLAPELLARYDEAFDCFNRGELDLMMEPYVEDAVFDVSAVFTDVRPMRGRTEIRRYWQTLHETWDGLRIEPVEGFDLGRGRFVIDQRMWGKGTRSGVDIDQRFAMLYEIDKRGKVVHAQLLPDVDAAFAAATTSEHGG
ncbi:MAG: nuclear transport factor 2 family protein [Actinomycetota bacterium]|nr:nuclear transport factor 2 family protein [Actinomycetota bacterium]